MEQILNSSPAINSQYNYQMHADISNGDWEGAYRTASEWLIAEPDQPVPIFIKNIACLFINPPAIIQNKRYLESMGSKAKDKEWKEVLNWFKEFQTESDRHNPYFQAVDFILQPPSKKKDSIEAALQEHPKNAELLFLQAIALRDHSASIEKLKLAVENKPEFPAALYR